MKLLLICLGALFLLSSCDLLTDEVNYDLADGQQAKINFTLNGGDFNNKSYSSSIYKDSNFDRFYTCYQSEVSKETNISFSSVANSVILQQRMYVSGDSIGNFTWRDYDFHTFFNEGGKSYSFWSSSNEIGSYTIEKYGKEIIKLSFSGYLYDSNLDQKVFISGTFTGRRKEYEVPSFNLD
jgi:hypothetical protein